jgi:L-lactate utilization protein LutB
MKGKTKVEKVFDTVKVFREIKDKISKEIKGMIFEQLNEYLDKNKMNIRKI